MDIKELNRKLQFEFMAKHQKAIAKVDAIMASLNKISAYQKLCKLERELAYSVAKNKFEKNVDKEKQENLKLVREQKQKLLTKLGIKKSDLVPKFECEKCQDIGFVGSVMCDCYKTRRNEELLKQCGYDISKMPTFENFGTKICADQSQADSLKKLKDKLYVWSQNYPNVKKRNLILTGTVGVGKTYISKCLASELAKRKYSICFVSAFEMNNMFLKYYTSFDSNKNVNISPLLDSDFLFIDDLGTEPIMKNVTLDHLYLVLSERDRLEKPIIITTNLLPENLLDRYGERIYSRLASKQTGAIFHLGGKDLRINQN